MTNITIADPRNTDLGAFTAIIADHRLLTIPGQQQAGHLNGVELLELVNDNHAPYTYIVSTDGIDETREQLREFFEYYLTVSCWGVACQAQVFYFSGNEFVAREAFGDPKGGAYTMTIRVACGVTDLSAEMARAVILFRGDKQPRRIVMVVPDISEQGCLVQLIDVAPRQTEILRCLRCGSDFGDEMPDEGFCVTCYSYMEQLGSPPRS
jgi:hypothetical protein